MSKMQIGVFYCTERKNLEKALNELGWENVLQVLPMPYPSSAYYEFCVIYKDEPKEKQ